MPRRLTLELDALSVDDCTCDRSCACPSAYFYCNTGPAFTNYSCNYTKNASCQYSETPPTA